MKHLPKCERGKLCSFLSALVFTFCSTFAQDFQQQRQNQIDRLDVTGLEKTLLLNAGLTNEIESNYFKERSTSNFPTSEKVTAEEWRNLYERLIYADLRTEGSKIKGINTLEETDPYKLTKSNVIPIGIMNLESIYMSVSEIADNEARKKNGESIDFSIYKKFNIIYASVLQEDVYQSEVEFSFSPELYITNHPSKLDSVALDFQDGKGFKNYSVSDKLISHRFGSTGLNPIVIRFDANGKTWLFETSVNVRQLERVTPYKEFQLFANRISTDTAKFDRSARTMLAGGNVRIILGCDQLFNKPIIIAEGFDMGQNVTLDAIEANYRIPLSQYLTEGYDLVLLDYTDARTAIEDNAQVLKALIQQVNQMKIGNDQSVVIGESMSGLVARWALRQMENEGIAHHVKLMICYDTPHQGANVPVGLTQLLWEANPSLFTQVILKFFAKKWRNFYQALATPAGTQLLLHWGGQLTGGVGSKAPAFDAFRSQLLALGNGGYPQQSRNIAIIHGSMNAGDRTIFNNYNYGSRILRSWTPFALQNSNIDVHTNALNQNESVFRFATWGIFANAVGINRKYSSPLNDDFLPGGRSSAPVPNKLFKETSNFNFCFVPTFSSIDYQGPRTTQSERELLNVSSITNSQTPFSTIYGGLAANTNTAHVSAAFIGWTAIGQSENLLTNIPACPALPIPPVPTISTYNTCYPFSEKRTTEDNTANISVSLATPSNGQYIHNWTVLPTQQAFTSTGDQITFQAERPGAYQIICVRTYPNRRDLQSAFTTTMIVDNCDDTTVVPESSNPPIIPDPDPADVWEGDFLLTTAADLSVFAHYTPAPKTLYATLADGTFISSTVLEASGMFEEFAALFAEIDPRIALPVTLTAFNVTAKRKTGSSAAILLTWSTSSEINSDHFEIEKSNNGKDWETIAGVQAKNDSSENEDYSFVDTDLDFTTTYYRLKMVDQDGTFAYSKIQSLRFGVEHEIVAFPNPIDTGNELQLLLGDQQIASIRIFNLTGKLVFESDRPTQKYIVQDLPVGKYVLEIRLKNGSKSSRTFVKR
ncbi:T9SS type A sorting domain-containing protein [Dyadobacter arcticus]|uniref:GPI inositol-deacylase PGAP1-like alpha/beta domain-containing protein n=1 Tax=Dyadobacter arcticus TaxID=1078754 RepID=A0ABX0UJA6_9BACT|nr:T9SS type A sorting domain-containing protein [Dyadobacter arcticus]NIJ53074.1 hypothetical protein [Dyadobacter arcticus]